MWQRSYLQRLKRDIDLWIERGWVTPANAEAILEEASRTPDTRRTPAILAILGAVLIGFAAMSFVAANWAELSKLTKLALIGTGLVAAYGVAWQTDRRGHPAFAQAALLTGLCLFGAAIMLIAQIYHIQTDDPGGVLAWCIAALAAAAILPSRPALALGMLLAAVWSGFAHSLYPQIPHLGFFLPWLFALALTLRFSWVAGFHLWIVTGYAWLALNAGPIGDWMGVGPAAIAALVVLDAIGLWLAALALRSRLPRFADVAEDYGIVVAFAVFWILHVIPANEAGTVNGLWIGVALAMALTVLAIGAAALARHRLEARHAVAIGGMSLAALAYPPLMHVMGPAIEWIYSAAFLALSVWLVSYGTSRHSRFLVNGAFAAFAAEVLYLYFATLGTMLDTAAFFLIGGLLLIAGSLFFERLRRRMVKAASEEEGAAS
ncbi:putative membrane protein [Parvibaculum indicum]|uniref:DUF2157 domain-containing protein n=1 Tax=Parvibaculum indicum TaxID=562969 RepID=UPI001420263D|nr:DUF2157 domain-containing protein [Parvibaculum indicum]NIJ40192.1 putative membrane protein [Parvibaculum indicum]